VRSRLTRGQHFITYPVEKRRVCNIGVFVSDRSRPADERVWTGPWVQPVDTQAMLDDFVGWDERALDVLKVCWLLIRSHVSAHPCLQLIKEPKRWALHEALPLDHWTQGRITLLGDSVHLSTPSCVLAD
jgi:salicylate hydroxylase